MRGVVLSRGAERDLGRIGPTETLARIGGALTSFAAGEANADIKPLAGAAPWHRLRVGDYRILYRPIEPGEGTRPDQRWLVARIIHRRDLERAVATLK